MLAAPQNIIWLKKERIPPGDWMFLSTIRNCLVHLSTDVLKPIIDLTEGLGGITITGRLEAYRQAVIRRALDLSQATVAAWNAELPVGSVVCARALLETLAVFHNLMAEVSAAVEDKNWAAASRIIDVFAWSTSEGPNRTTGKPGGPPNIGMQVKRFIEATQPNAVQFWHQISDFSHPNGQPMMAHFGVLRDGQFNERSTEDSAPEVFRAVHNCLFSICWLYNAMDDFDRLLDSIRYSDEPPVLE